MRRRVIIRFCFRSASDSASCDHASRHATWCFSQRRGVPPRSIVRRATFASLQAHWECSKCHLHNCSVTKRCVACGSADASRPADLTNNNCSTMTSVTSRREGNANWCRCHEAGGRGGADGPTSPGASLDAPGANLNMVLREGCTAECAECQGECRGHGDADDVGPRSPKRQSPSVYERVKSKVSRSLSNGSVVQKLWLDGVPRAGLFRRPSSLVVDNLPEDSVDAPDCSRTKCSVNDNNRSCDEVNQNSEAATWSCVRCTLENGAGRDRCEVCETPRRSKLGPKPPANTIPRNGLVITVPDWDMAPPALPPKARHQAPAPSASRSQADSSWNRVSYRRSLSEMASSEAEKIAPNRHSMVETDAQGNIAVKASANNVNLQLAPRTRFSYIGLSEPSTQVRSPGVVARHAAAGRKRMSLQVKTSNGSLPVPPGSVQTTASAFTDLQPSTSSLERMWTCTKCSYAYNPLWSDSCDICNSVRSPPSLTEPSLITVTKDSVRYTPTKQEIVQDSDSLISDNLSSRGSSATLATLEQDLEDDFQVNEKFARRTCSLTMPIV